MGRRRAGRQWGARSSRTSKPQAWRLADPCSELPAAAGDGWQVVRYGAGDFYGLHHDSSEHGRSFTGMRLVTVLVYLSSVPPGAYCDDVRTRAAPGPSAVRLPPELALPL